MNPLKVGQKLYYVEKDFGRRALKPKEVTIEKIGRRYFYIEYGTRFFIDTMSQDSGQYSSRGKCYLTLKDYEEEEEGIRLSNKILEFFHFPFRKLILDQKRRIYAIIQETKE